MTAEEKEMGDFPESQGLLLGQGFALGGKVDHIGQGAAGGHYVQEMCIRDSHGGTFWRSWLSGRQ